MTMMVPHPHRFHSSTKRKDSGRRSNIAAATLLLFYLLLLSHSISASSAFQFHALPPQLSSSSSSSSSLRHGSVRSGASSRNYETSCVTSSRPSTALPAAAPISPSVIHPSDDWANVATLSFAASLAQLLGKSTAVGRLLGAPVTAMALTFGLSSLSWLPSSVVSSPRAPLRTLLPAGGSPAASFLQSLSLSLATPLLLLGTSLRGSALRRCRTSLAAFAAASLGTLLGAALPFSTRRLPAALAASLPRGDDGIKIAAALVAKNIGGGINYMAVCACLGASAESVAAGLCVDNVMALLYFPTVSLLASRYDDLDDEEEEEEEDEEEAIRNDGSARDNKQHDTTATSPVESLSHAITLAALLTSAGRWLDSRLHKIISAFSDAASTPLNLSLPLTTLLTVLFATYYPPNLFLSSFSTTTCNNAQPQPTIHGHKKTKPRSNDIAKAGETLGTSLLYLFFATAGAPGWKLKDSVQRSFPAIATFLACLYGGHAFFLWSIRTLVDARHTDGRRDNHPFWKKATAPQRLLTASSAAIGGPATAAALAQSQRWKSLLTPSLVVGNVGYAMATFVGLAFYGVFR